VLHLACAQIRLVAEERPISGRRMGILHGEEHDVSQQFEQPPVFQPQPTIIVNTPRQQQSQALPALASFCIPGLGQLIQGRALAALGFFCVNAFASLTVLATAGIGLLWSIPLWLWNITDAAKYRG
jgi:hypothetical protein